MAFDSFAEFVAMGRHGLYVWLVFGVAAAALFLGVTLARGQMRRLARQLRLERAAQKLENS